MSDYKIKATELVYPIPISDGHIVTIHNLPCDLNRSDADKICGVIRALSVTDLVRREANEKL